ncbi:MAG: putative Ig domain-containing protein [Thermoplasmata archaeon]
MSHSEKVLAMVIALVLTATMLSGCIGEPGEKTKSNNAPVIVAISAQKAIAGVPFAYQVIATDADGDKLTYTDDTSLFVINSTTGAIAFTPSAADVGNYTIVIFASDGKAVANATFTLDIAPAINHAPVITAIPPQGATNGTLFIYQVVATDADNDILTYTSNIGSITSTGLFSYTPTSVGTYNITITVNDAKAESTTTFILVVEKPGTAPPAFSASVADAPDSITTYSVAPTGYSSPTDAVGAKRLATKTGAQATSAFTAGATVAPRPYMVSGTTYAFAVTYSGDVWSGPSITVTVTYENEKGTSSTTTAVFPATPFSTGYTVNASLASGDVGVKKVTGVTLAGATFAANNIFYVNTTAYDTVAKITADNGKPGDITKLTIYIKVGASGDWKKLTPDASNPYKIGAIVLDNAATDLSWDVGESIYLSETNATGDIAPDTTQPVYVKVIHEPSSSTIYESKTGVNVL